MIEIHNSLTGRKQPLETIEPKHVRMYVCGMTVYDYCHVGHARSLVVFDVVRRYLRNRGYRLTHGMRKHHRHRRQDHRARGRGTARRSARWTGRFIAALNEDCAALGVETPEHEPRGDRVRRRDHRDGADPGRQGLRLRRRRRRRALFGQQVRWLRAAVRQEAGRPAGRRARGDRRRQARPARFRAVESLEAR